MAAQKYAEVVGTPYSVYVATVGTAFPTVDAAPSTAWTLLGVNGINNQGTAGVTVNLGETVQEFVPAGSTYPVKAWRTDEKATVDFSLVDTTVEAMSAILDNAAITTVLPTTGNAGYKSIKLKRSIAVATYALLIRGLSPYDDGTGLNAQYEFTRVYQSGSQAPKYLKGTPAELSVQFTILDDVSGQDPGLYLAQNAAHS